MLTTQRVSKHFAILGLIFMLLFVGYPAWAAARTQFSLDELTEMSLEDLMNIQVTSVAKKAQKLSEAAAAIYVITQEDIRRSGATSIPEALRMVPGLQVARIDANKWAISSRGFNGQWANKLLVLFDGRSVYSPYFSGVFWGIQDTVLEDIDRIEIIRGPGAALWGANAVNGVINIVTKNSADTQGGLVSGGTGTEEHGFGTLRYGSQIGTNTTYRVFAKYFERDNSSDDSADGWDVWRGGFRLDWDGLDSNSLTLQGDIFDGDMGQTSEFASLTPPFARVEDTDRDMSGGNLLTRWKHTFSDTSDTALQLYFDQTRRRQLFGGDDFQLVEKTFDVDFQHRFSWGVRQDIVWGLGYRFISDDIGNHYTTRVNPDSREVHLWSSFVQDEITFWEEQLRLTLGSKFEHNDYTGFEMQPSARLMWTPVSRHAVWASVSRAVRTPSRFENDFRLNPVVVPGGPGTPPMMVSLFGNRDLESEELVAYELGYRFMPEEQFSIDMTAFYNDYDKLITGSPTGVFFEPMPAPAHLVSALRLENQLDGKTYGVELACNWQPINWWSLKTAYTYLQMELDHENSGGDAFMDGTGMDTSPRHQVSLRSMLELPKNLELDLWVRYVDSLPDLNVDSYIALDARLGWKPIERLEVSLVGQNLLEDQHLEFTEIGFTPREIERSIYGKITWSF